MSVGPIPLQFPSNELPVSRNLETGKKNQVVYYGYRPKDSYNVHKRFARPEGYEYEFNGPLKSAVEYISRIKHEEENMRRFEGMRPGCGEECIRFDSIFECGNLDKAVLVKDNEYELYLRVDCNTHSHT